MMIEREFSMTCGCLNRPSAKVIVYDDSGAAHLIGSIEDVFSCCEKIFQIHNHDGNVIYKVKTPAC